MGKQSINTARVKGLIPSRNAYSGSVYFQTYLSSFFHTSCCKLVQFFPITVGTAWCKRVSMRAVGFIGRFLELRYRNQYWKREGWIDAFLSPFKWLWPLAPLYDGKGF